MKKILAFSGSNSSTSINQQLINAVVNYVDGAKVQVIDLRDYTTVMYSIDEEKTNGIPESMLELRKIMKSVDGFIISTPEHNGSIPAFFKNILDWQSRQGSKIFLEKPVVFLSTSDGARGGASALGHLLEIMPYRGAKVIGGHSVGGFKDKFSEGKLNDQEDKEIIKDLFSQLVDAL